MLFESDASYGRLVKGFGIFFLVLLSCVLGVSSPATSPFVVGALGAVFALFTRYFNTRDEGVGSGILLVFTDLRIKHFSVIGLVSLLYSLVFGALLGASTSFLFIGALLPLGHIYPGGSEVVPAAVSALSSSNFLLSGACFALVFVVRVFAETYILVFRVGQKYLSK